MNKEGALVKSWTFHVINGGRPNLKAKIKTIKVEANPLVLVNSNQLTAKLKEEVMLVSEKSISVKRKSEERALIQKKTIKGELEILICLAVFTEPLRVVDSVETKSAKITILNNSRANTKVTGLVDMRTNEAAKFRVTKRKSRATVEILTPDLQPSVYNRGVAKKGLINKTYVSICKIKLLKIRWSAKTQIVGEFQVTSTFIKGSVVKTRVYQSVFILGARVV